MSITFRNYTSKPLHTPDYEKVREFLIRINSDKFHELRMPWGAWEWNVTHQNLDRTNLDKIGLWEDSAEIVALAMYESVLGEGFLIAAPGYESLKPELVKYAKENLRNDEGKLKILICDGDYDFARIARDNSFRPTQEKDNNAVLDIDKMPHYSLPEGFSFASMAEGWNYEQYNRVMRRSFRGDENPEYNEEIAATRKLMLSSPMIIPELVVAVVAPSGNYASHCGMWYKPGEFYCYVEPVATDPNYRKLGLGKAVVLEAISRCAKLGAKQAMVGSSQQFYYNIGFNPVKTMTYWELT